MPNPMSSAASFGNASLTKYGRTRALCMALAFSVLGAGAALAQDPAATSVDPAKDKLVRKLMAVTGADKIGTQVVEALFIQARGGFPQVPDTEWKEIQKIVKADELTDQIVPIYAKNFTEGELTELLNFYSTPLGKKVIAALPAMSQESFTVGQRWGDQKLGQIAERLRTDGFQPMQNPHRMMGPGAGMPGSGAPAKAPASAKPADAKPADAKPASAKPADATKTPDAPKAAPAPEAPKAPAPAPAPKP